MGNTIRQLNPLNVEKFTEAIKNDQYIKQCCERLNSVYETYKPKIIYCLVTKEIKYIYDPEVKKSIDAIKIAINLRIKQLESHYLR